VDVNELMNLKRQLTDDEMDFIEQQLLSRARELDAEIQKLTKDLDADDPDVAKLRAAPAKITRGVESAIECRVAAVEIETSTWRKLAHKKDPPEAEVLYDWEKLPVYAWNNEFARVIGRLLMQLPRRLHVRIHNLAGQATLISNCIALGHRDAAPGEVISKDELRAYRVIGYHATFTTMELLEEISGLTRSARSDLAHGMSLVGRIRKQFEADLAELDQVRLESAPTVH
jgi:hypothetical protein